MTNFSSNFEPSIACLKIAHVIFFWGKICWKVAKEANFPNLLAHFFLPKFFIKFSRVTNRHLARINLLLVENFGNSSPSVFMIFLFFFVDFLLKICLVSSPSPNSPSKTRDCTGKSNGRLRVQKFDEKFAKFPPRWPKGLFICSCACLDELASTSAFPTRAPTVDQQPTNGSLGEYLYQLRTSGPGKGTPIESVFWKFV